jgi:hypothetical protein
MGDEYRRDMGFLEINTELKQKKTEDIMIIEDTCVGFPKVIIY